METGNTYWWGWQRVYWIHQGGNVSLLQHEVITFGTQLTGNNSITFRSVFARSLLTGSYCLRCSHCHHSRHHRVAHHRRPDRKSEHMKRNIGSKMPTIMSQSSFCANRFQTILNALRPSAKVDVDLTVLALRSHAHSVPSLIYLCVKRA